MNEKVLGGGYAAFDSSSGWMTRAPYLQCKVISLPIAYAEQVYETNILVNEIAIKTMVAHNESHRMFFFS